VRIVLFMAVFVFSISVLAELRSKSGGGASKVENDGYYGSDWQKMDRELEKEAEKAGPDNTRKDQKKGQNLKKPGGKKK